MEEFRNRMDCLSGSSFNSNIILVCVCVSEREREPKLFWIYDICMYVCVCVYERTRARACVKYVYF